jgi:4-amino-4-deoxychorismate lyase
VTISPCLIETMRLEHGRIALWPGHLRRLAASSAALGYAWDAGAVRRQLEQRCAGLGKSDVHQVRLLLARDGECRIETRPLAPTPTPVRIALEPEPLSADRVWLSHKTTHRPWYAPAQAWLAEHAEFFDVIYSNAQGQVCEGSRSNIYLLDDQGRWLTPPVHCGLLPGVQRQALIDAGRAHEAILSAEDLRGAAALRVSNALRGWLDARL